MKKQIKRHIKLLSEKFNHEIGYDKDVLIVKNTINEIRIWEQDKYGTNVVYNEGKESTIELKLKIDDFYNVLIEILKRKSYTEKLMIGDGILLTVEEWIKEEGEFAENKIEQLKMDIENKQIEYSELGGNRFMAEYFKGVLILTDDLCWGKSNVIPL